MSPSQHSPFLQPVQQRLIFLPFLLPRPSGPCKGCLPLSMGPFCCPSKDPRNWWHLSVCPSLRGILTLGYVHLASSNCTTGKPPPPPPPCHSLSLDLGSGSKGCVTDYDCTEGLSVSRMKELASGHGQGSLPSHSVSLWSAHPHKHAAAGACAAQFRHKTWPQKLTGFKDREALCIVGSLSAIFLFLTPRFHLRPGRDLRFYAIKPQNVGRSVRD